MVWYKFLYAEGGFGMSGVRARRRPSAEDLMHEVDELLRVHQENLSSWVERWQQAQDQRLEALARKRHEVCGIDGGNEGVRALGCPGRQG